MLDVGIGTGIAADQLRAAGCRVLGVDVDPRMAEFARSRGCVVEVATFEDWDSGGRMFDAVVAAQTWHWSTRWRGRQRPDAFSLPVAAWPSSGTPTVGGRFTLDYTTLLVTAARRCG